MMIIMMNTKKTKIIRKLFEGFNKDYLKPIKTDDSSDGKKSSYIEYTSKGHKCENLSPKEYLNMIRPYLRDLMNDHKTPMKLTNKVNNNDTKFGEWKIQLVMLNNYISSENFEETCYIYSESNNIENFMDSDTDDIIYKLFDTVLQRFQEARETSNERESKFIHESVAILYYYFHKIDMKRGESYIEPPIWLKNKKSTINPKIKNDDNCFQHAISAALNHRNIGRNLQKISKIEPIINKYNWKGIEFPTEQKGWKKFEQKSKTIARNILYVPYSTKQICRAYKSEYKNECKNQAILLMITDGKKSHYLALKSEPIFYGGKLCNCPVKRLSRLFRRITSIHHGDFYCLKCYHSCSTENTT